MCTPQAPELRGGNDEMQGSTRVEKKTRIKLVVSVLVVDFVADCLCIACTPDTFLLITLAVRLSRYMLQIRTTEGIFVIFMWSSYNIISKSHDV